MFSGEDLSLFILFFYLCCLLLSEKRWCWIPTASSPEGGPLRLRLLLLKLGPPLPPGTPRTVAVECLLDRNVLFDLNILADPPWWFNWSAGVVFALLRVGTTVSTGDGGTICGLMGGGRGGGGKTGRTGKAAAAWSCCSGTLFRCLRPDNNSHNVSNIAESHAKEKKSKGHFWGCS